MTQRLLRIKRWILLVLVFEINVFNSAVGEEENGEYPNWFAGAEDDTENEDDSILETIVDEVIDSYFDKSSRQNDADVEVILNPGPMLAPDIIIGHFIDSKVNIHDTLLEALGLPPDSSRNVSSLMAESSASPNMIGQHRGLEIDRDSKSSLLSSEYYDSLNEIPTDSQLKYVKEHYGDDKDDEENGLLLKEGRSQYCHRKINETSGKFTLNFTQDCTILIATPKKKSKIILHCAPIKLGNCSTTRDSLTVNLKGDLRFGRNSYLYCGQTAQVRVTSLRRRISLRIRQNPGVPEETQCSFFSRQQRDYSPDERNHDANSGTNCGRLGRSSKIVGGRRVFTPRLFPWVAQLDISRTDGTQTACTGSLVSPEYILTAAHCLKNSESISVFMGGTDRLEFTGSEVIVQAEKYILHRKWNTRTLAADIALVKLTDPVKYTEEIFPICLPSGRLRRESMTGRKGVAVGWGRLDTKLQAPRQLYRVRLPILNERSCQSFYLRYFQPKTMFCTDSTLESAICYGDSGGSLMYKRQEKVYQLGVASFSLSKTCGESPDVFTKVGEYTAWIKNRIRPDG